MSPISSTEATLINTAITVMPAILALIKGSTPAGTPPPTDDQVLAALQSATTSSIAKDDAWLALNPTT